MSSIFVRDAFLDFLKNRFPTEKVVEIETDYEELEDFLSENDIAMGTPWIGIQFLASDEFAVDILSNNVQGKYREGGTVFLHIVERARLQCHRAILTRADAIRDALRGMRIANDITIRSVHPTVFGISDTLHFESGFTAGMVQVTFTRDLIL